jgi:ribonuclease-3
MQQVSPYNKNNTPITVKTIAGIMGRYGLSIRVNNLALYQQAFTNSSYVKDNYNIEMFEKDRLEMERAGIKVVPLQDESNESFEFLGDSFAKAFIAEYISERYCKPHHNEGFLSTLKSRLEDTKAFASYARQMNLGYYMLISKQIEDNNGRDSEKLLEDTFEAFLAALVKDQHYEVIRTLIRRIMETEVDFAEILSEDLNYMKRLQNFYISNKWSPPKYEDIKEEKINGKNYYTIAVKDFEGNIINETISEEQSKKKAKMESAKKALKLFNQY